MSELGQLERHHEEFKRRGVRIIAISNDDQATAQKTQAGLPHLVIVSDKDQTMAKAMQVIHPGADPNTGGDTNAPTTFLVAGDGEVRWLFRPDRIIVRLSPTQLLAAVDNAWPASMGTK